MSEYGDTTEGRAELLTRFSRFLEVLFELLPALRAPQPLRARADQLDALVAALFEAEDAAEEDAVRQLRRAAVALRTQAVAAAHTEVVELAVFASWLDGALAQGSAAREQISTAFPRLLEMLRDRELPVRVQSALTLKELIESRCLESDAVLGVLPQLLECLFSLIREVGADEIVSTLDTLIEHYGEQMAPYSLQVVTALVASFMQLVEEDANGDKDDDDGDASSSSSDDDDNDDNVASSRKRAITNLLASETPPKAKASKPLISEIK